MSLLYKVAEVRIEKLERVFALASMVVDTALAFYGEDGTSFASSQEFFAVFRNFTLAYEVHLIPTCLKMRQLIPASS